LTDRRHALRRFAARNIWLMQKENDFGLQFGRRSE
jgi:hypothetical protein